MHTQEETYTLLDSDHAKGSNRYVFRFSPHWRQCQGKSLTIGVRSVKQILSKRHVWIDGLMLHGGEGKGHEEMDVSPDVSIAGDWTELNDKLLRHRLESFEIFKTANPETHFTAGDYSIGYDITQSSINIVANAKSNGKRYLVFEGDEGGKQGVDISDDLLVMWGVEVDRKAELIEDLFNATHSGEVDQSEGPPGASVINQIEKVIRKWKGKLELIYDEEARITRISFIGIWDRSPLCIHASFVDLSSHQWLGTCNEQFVPPKEWFVCYEDQKFWIELFSLDGKPVELPDQKDQIIIEAMMNSYL